MDRSKSQLTLSLLIIFLGLALLIYMIVVENEPGALPLALIIGGITWFGFIRFKMTKHKN